MDLSFTRIQTLCVPLLLHSGNHRRFPTSMRRHGIGFPISSSPMMHPPTETPPPCMATPPSVELGPLRLPLKPPWLYFGLASFSLTGLGLNVCMFASVDSLLCALVSILVLILACFMFAPKLFVGMSLRLLEFYENQVGDNY